MADKQKKPVTMSSAHEAAVVADLIDAFCKTNKLEEPREKWEKNLIHPEDNLLRKSTIVPNGIRRGIEC